MPDAPDAFMDELCEVLMVLAIEHLNRWLRSATFWQDCLAMGWVYAERGTLYLTPLEATVTPTGVAVAGGAVQ